MTSFTRYYNKDKKLISISMAEMDELITDESNKFKIAEYIYERLYTRFLKIFDFENKKTLKYDKNGSTEFRNEFKEEYKNGFLQLAASSLLIETLAAFLTGENETAGGKASNRFNEVFRYAQEKKNSLEKFVSNNDFYKKIRCGILHQGETKGSYTITRKGDKLLEGGKINAHLFHQALKELLNSYQQDLEAKSWDDKLWDACRQKIRHIINNAK